MESRPNRGRRGGVPWIGGWGRSSSDPPEEVGKKGKDDDANQPSRSSMSQDNESHRTEEELVQQFHSIDVISKVDPKSLGNDREDDPAPPTPSSYQSVEVVYPSDDIEDILSCMNDNDDNDDAPSETWSLLVQANKPKLSSQRGLFPSHPYSNKGRICSMCQCRRNYLPALFGISVLLASAMIFYAMYMEPQWFEYYNLYIGGGGDDDDTGFSIRGIQAQLLVNKVHLNILGNARSKGNQKMANSDNGHAPEGCESTVLLIRHCEKLNLKSHCDYQGYERAVYLSTLFGHDHERWPAPDAIYALQPSHRSNPKRRNYREIETVQAVAKKFKMDINDSYGPNDNPHIARRILDSIRNGEVCGKVVLVSWKHSELPDLAQHLGT